MVLIKYFFKSILLLSILSLAACTKYTTVRKNPEFEIETLRRDKLTLLPVISEVNLVEVGSKKTRLDDYEYHIEQVLKNTLLQSFTKQEFNIAFLSRKELHEQGLLGHYARLRDAVDESAVKLYENDQMKTEQAFTIQENIGRHLTQSFYDHNYKYLIFPVFSSLYHSNGARMADYLMVSLIGGVAQCSELQHLFIAIVETRTGNIMWENKIAYCSSTYFALNQRGLSDEEVDKQMAEKVVNFNLKALFYPEKK